MINQTPISARINTYYLELMRASTIPTNKYLNYGAEHFYKMYVALIDDWAHGRREDVLNWLNKGDTSTALEMREIYRRISHITGLCK